MPSTHDDSTPRTRRRGDELRTAILRAAWAEISEGGLARATFDSIAKRAGAGRASLYRHWPDRASLLADAMSLAAADGVGVTTPSGDLRADLVDFLGGVCERLAGPMGTVTRGLVAELVDSSDLSRFEAMAQAPVAEVATILRAAGATADEVAGVPWRVLNVGTDLVAHAFLISGVAPAREECEEVVDQVWLPVLARYVAAADAA